MLSINFFFTCRKKIKNINFNRWISKKILYNVRWKSPFMSFKRLYFRFYLRLYQINKRRDQKRFIKKSQWLFAISEIRVRKNRILIVWSVPDNCWNNCSSITVIIYVWLYWITEYFAFTNIINSFHSIDTMKKGDQICEYEFY